MEQQMIRRIYMVGYLTYILSISAHKFVSQKQMFHQTEIITVFNTNEQKMSKINTKLNYNLFDK